jgi:hypothetical protein
VLVSGACVGHHEDPLAIGVKRIALNLAFSDEAKAVPLPPEQVIVQIPVDQSVVLPPEIVLPARPKPVTRQPVVPPPTKCPAAAPDTFPSEPVTIFARGAPKAGVYTLHNEGTITLGIGAFSLPLPYPRRSTVEIRNVVVQDAVAGGEALPPAVRALAGISPVVTFDAFKTVSPELAILNSYRYDEAKLTLTKRVILTPSETTTFQPTPDITFMQFGKGEADSWSSAGIDQPHNLGMVVQGKIDNREFVDLCGKVYDAFHVTSNENVADLASGGTSGTDVAKPNIYWFANQLGALIIKEEGHFTQTIRVQGNIASLKFDYTSTMDSVDPTPAPVK